MYLNVNDHEEGKFKKMCTEPSYSMKSFTTDFSKQIFKDYFCPRIQYDTGGLTTIYLYAFNSLFMFLFIF